MRAFLYKILPHSWIPYILHTRPRAWFIVSAHMSVGFILANGFNFSDNQIQTWLLAIIAWGILGNGGTLAINSAFDKDEGDIGYLENPPAIPKRLWLFALVLLLAGMPLAFFLGKQFFLAYLICFTLSILYSVPPFRLKSRAGYDILVNSTGFGSLTIYAGWAATGQPITPTITNILFAFFFLFVGFYPLTQIYQMEEDKKRGDLTIARALTKKYALLFSIAAVVVAFIFLFSEISKRYLEIRSIGIIFAMFSWVFVLIPWYVKHQEVDTKYEQSAFYKALYAWAVTDIAVAVAMIPGLF